MTDESLLIVDGDRFVHDALERALEGLGATDCIRKPFDPIEVRARVEAALRLGRMIGLLRDQAWIDPLTGLENRAALDAALDAAAADFERVGQPAALLLLDLDRFKEVNDEYGHGVGDELLRGVGAAIHAGCRPLRHLGALRRRRVRGGVHAGGGRGRPDRGRTRAGRDPARRAEAKRAGGDRLVTRALRG